jgi:hypothetical protein
MASAAKQSSLAAAALDAAILDCFVGFASSQ